MISLRSKFEPHIIPVNGSQLAKLKSLFLTCHFYKIHSVEAVGLKGSNFTFKNYAFSEYAIFGAISQTRASETHATFKLHYQTESIQCMLLTIPIEFESIRTF